MTTATRTSTYTGIGNRTEYQIHKSRTRQCNLIDYTERKLLKHVDDTFDQQQKQVLSDLLLKYKRGEVAIAWRRGSPLYINVLKENV